MEPLLYSCHFNDLFMKSSKVWLIMRFKIFVQVYMMVLTRNGCGWCIWTKFAIVILNAVSKIRKNIYKSDIQVTFKLYTHFSCLQILHSNKITFTEYGLTQWISKLHGSFEIHWVRQYLANLMGLVGMVNVTVYKTKPIFTGCRHGKLSQFLTLLKVFLWQCDNGTLYFFHTVVYGFFLISKTICIPIYPDWSSPVYWNTSFF